MAKRLKEWVVKHSGTALPTDLEPRYDSATHGLSMVTLEPVTRGQVLVRVPLRLMITAASAEADPEYGRLVREGPLTEWQALVLALLCERARGAASFWEPYIGQLPDQSDHPLTWGPDRLAWLEGSSMLDTLVARQKQVEEDCEVLQLVGANDLPLAQAWAKDNPLEGALVTPRSVRWAAATLLSRAFSIDLADDEALEGDLSYFGSWVGAAATPGSPSSGDVLALVPWADTLHHCSAAGPESCLRYNPELRAASLCAHTTYRPGDEVFDSYGPSLSPCDLLLDWGFVDPTCNNHRADVNPLAVVEPRSERAAALLAALQDAYLGPDGPKTGGEDTQQQGKGGPVWLAVTPSGPDLTLLTWLRAALSSDAELIRAGWRVKAGRADVQLACRVAGRLSVPSSRDQEARVLYALHRHLNARLDAYPTPPQMDWHKGSGALALERRPLEAVLLALASEKQALQGALAAVDEALERLMQGCPLEELYLAWEQEEGEAGDEEWDGERGEGGGQVVGPRGVAGQPYWMDVSHTGYMARGGHEGRGHGYLSASSDEDGAAGGEPAG